MRSHSARGWRLRQTGRRAIRSGATRLRLEPLEERRLLSAAASGGLDRASPLLVDPGAYDPQSILVRFVSEEACAESGLGAAAEHGPGGMKIGRTFSLLPGLREVKLPSGTDVASALAAYRSDPLVLYAEPNYTVGLARTPDDPQFDSLWGLHNIGQTGGTADADIDAPEAWDLSTGSGSIIVAVIDTGVDYTHPDLEDNMWVNAGEIPGNEVDDDGNGFVDDVHGYDFANHDGNPMDDHYHGTHVAGTIGAVGDNGIGVAGVNWNVQIMALKFLDDTGYGTTSDAIEALEYAVANGATVSNNSWGDKVFSQALYDAIDSARAEGHIFVAAAGNGNFIGIGQDNDAKPFYPASYDLDNIVAVAALDHNDNKAIFSNYGAASVDLGAPGVSILSTSPGNDYRTLDGTSMAAPHVAGAAALLCGRSPESPYWQVIDNMLSSVDPVDSLAGITVTGGRLNLAAALIPQALGPFVVDSSPAGETGFPTGSLRVRFSEPVDPGTFTVDDVVSFDGPEGPIDVTRVDMVADSGQRDFDIVFPTQSTFGLYSLTIGPQILDLAGNPMDQDKDETGGEPEDVYTAEFSIVPFHAEFDFGVAGSPVADGFTQILPGTAYDPAEGYGWQAGMVFGVDRGTGTPLTRDLNYARDMTFAVDVRPGTYDVTLTTGDEGPYVHDQVGIYLEDAQVDLITTAGGEVLTRTYSGVVISDAQLNLRMASLGGTDVNAVISGLELLRTGPDAAGPRVVDANPVGEILGPADHVTVTFDEAIQEGSFTVEDVAELSGPSGPIAPTGVSRLSEKQYEVLFAPQTALGVYRLTIGPEILDLSGNLMDQDGDRINGEPEEDRFTTQWTLSNAIRFDFGTASSPVAADYRQVLPGTTYDPVAGYGWQVASEGALDRGAGTALTRDLHYARDMTFAVDVADGTYDVTLTAGDEGFYAHDQVGVYLEGAQVDTLSTAGGEVLTICYAGVSVSDGQLDVRLADLGGSDVYAVVNGLEISVDVAGPRVVGASPAGETLGPIHRVSVTFDEAVEEGSFTVEDVVELTGPAGPIAASSVNRSSETEYEVVFAPQSDLGVYRLTIGPEILDLMGNPMDQDDDGISGEPAEDQFTTEWTLTDAVRFDFGTASSPVAAGYRQVLPGTTYDPSAGYGWQVASEGALDRGAGTALTRDLHYARDMTFAVDVADGTYNVTLITGDEGFYAHDQVGVYLEGTQVDTVSTAGRQVLTIGYAGVSVSDGQLNVRLADLGGSDVYAVINGLEVSVDVAGPRVVGASPAGETLGPVDRVSVTFDEAVEEGSFTVEDVVELTGPAGPIAASSVNRSSETEYEVVFAPQGDPGVYRLTIGPEILDLVGNPMDQDGDGISGEPADDQFTTEWTLTDAVRFDFGTASSPVAAGYRQVLPGTTYDPSAGYGWQAGSVGGVDRRVGTPLTRDLHYARDMTFAVDLPNGTYDVTLITGDEGFYAHDQVGVYLEGTQVDTVSTAGRQVLTIGYAGVSVSDGQLNVRLADLGGSDLYAVINGLEVAVADGGSSMAAAAGAGESASAWQQDDLLEDVIAELGRDLAARRSQHDGRGSVSSTVQDWLFLMLY